MPKTLMLRNIPDVVYERLKRSAQASRRSVGSEAMACLGAALLSAPISAGERLARARELRATLPQGSFSAHDVDARKREGRS